MHKCRELARVASLSGGTSAKAELRLVEKFYPKLRALDARQACGHDLNMVQAHDLEALRGGCPHLESIDLRLVRNEDIPVPTSHSVLSTSTAACLERWLQAGEMQVLVHTCTARVTRAGELVDTFELRDTQRISQLFTAVAKVIARGQSRFDLRMRGIPLRAFRQSFGAELRMSRQEHMEVLEIGWMEPGVSPEQWAQWIADPVMYAFSRNNTWAPNPILNAAVPRWGLDHTLGRFYQAHGTRLGWSQVVRPWLLRHAQFFEAPGSIADLCSSCDCLLGSYLSTLAAIFMEFEH